jgi:uncharacterized protein Yka (UPF0111/DUF47 family)
MKFIPQLKRKILRIFYQVQFYWYVMLQIVNIIHHVLGVEDSCEREDRYYKKIAELENKIRHV